MDHVAILRKARISKGDNLLGDVLSGSKTIESRWYVNKISPWNKIDQGDRVFFKESGGPVCAVAEVEKVLQYENLNPQITKNIVKEYGSKIAPSTSEKKFIDWAEKQDKKRYCILVFLKNVKKISPFEINKKGFGISSAWLEVGDINLVKI